MAGFGCPPKVSAVQILVYCATPPDSSWPEQYCAVAPARTPQLGFDHHLTQRFASDLDLVFGLQSFACRRRPLAGVHRIEQNPDDLVPLLGVDSPVRRPTSQLMDHYPVAFGFHPLQ